MSAKTPAVHFEPDETHITDDYSDLNFSTRHAVQQLLEESTAVGVAVGRYDEDLSIIFLSRIFVRNLGFDPDIAHELYGRSLRDFVFEDEAGLLSSLRPGQPLAGNRIRLKDATGAPLCVMLNKSEELNSQGELCWLLSARIAPEMDTLALMNEVFQTGTWTVSCNASGEIEQTTYSQDLRRMLGYTNEQEFPDHIDTLFSVVHPEDADMVYSSLEAALKDPASNFHLDVTYRARRRNGSYMWLRSVGAAVRRLDGSVSRAAGITLNIDESHEREALAQKLLKEKNAKEELLSGLVRMIDRYALCNLDEDSYEFYKFDERLGYPKRGRFSAFLSKMDERMRMTEGERAMSEALSVEHLRRVILAPEDSYRFDYAVKDEEQYFGMAVLPLEFGQNGVSRVLLAVQDVTQIMKEEFRARQALDDAFSYANRANEAKTRFLSQMSHEIRTPMNGIVGMTALAAAHAEDPERVRDALDKITLSSRHLLSLINEVLDMNKIESGNISLNEEAFNLSELVESLVTMIKPQVDEKRHCLSVTFEGLEHEDVLGDALRLQQVFVNLMSNAIKYTPEGGKIQFTVRERPSNQSRFGRYEFVFEDNGIGMSQETLERVFEPFARASDERVERVRGAGLGMPISRNIVRMMGGDIKVESTPEVGTRYTVAVFLKLQDKEASSGRQSAPKREEALAKSYPGKRVLVVEDNAINLEVACEILRLAQLEVDSAVDGEQAVRIVTESEPGYYDLVLMDVMMPNMDGHEATRAIRAHGSEYCRMLPIVAMTANAFAEDVQAARDAGMNDHVAKPLDFKKLAAILDTYCG